MDEDELQRVLDALEGGAAEPDRATLDALFDLQYETLDVDRSRALLERALHPEVTERLQQRLVVASTAHAELVPLYERIGLEGHAWAREQVMNKLGRASTDEAIDAMVRVLAAHPETRVTSFPGEAASKLFARMELPSLGERAIEGLVGAWDNAQRAASVGQITISESARANAARLFAGAARDLWTALTPLQRADGPFFWWNREGYSKRASILTALLPILEGQAGLEVARAAQHADDPYVRAAAITALLAHDEPIDPRALERTAEHPGTRNALHARMAERGLPDFPVELAALERLAEGRLAEWLASPWEFDRVPFALSLRRRVDVPTELGVAACFVFAFRYEPEAGVGGEEWALALSGPFLEGETSGPHRLGLTGTLGVPDDDDHVEAVVRDIPDTIARAIAQATTRPND